MVKIEELQAHFRRFQEKRIGTSIPEFLDFIENEQKTAKKGGVVPMEERNAHIRLRSLEEQQAANKQIDPENDMDNL